MDDAVAESVPPPGSRRHQKWLPDNYPGGATSPVAHPATTSETSAATQPDHPWQTVVWDDPVNLMSYVTYVFQTHFGYNRDQAETLMLTVHSEGRAIVASGRRERMEAHVEAMHTYGLWATLEHDGAS